MKEGPNGRAYDEYMVWLLQGRTIEEIRARQEERDAEAYALRESGLTYREVGERMGVGISAARTMDARHLRRARFRIARFADSIANWQAYQSAATPEEEAAMDRLMGVTLDQIKKPT